MFSTCIVTKRASSRLLKMPPKLQTSLRYVINCQLYRESAIILLIWSSHDHLSFCLSVILLSLVLTCQTTPAAITKSSLSAARRIGLLLLEIVKILREFSRQDSATC